MFAFSPGWLVDHKAALAKQRLTKTVGELKGKSLPILKLHGEKSNELKRSMTTLSCQVRMPCDRTVSALKALFPRMLETSVTQYGTAADAVARVKRCRWIHGKHGKEKTKGVVSTTGNRIHDKIC